MDRKIGVAVVGTGYWGVNYVRTFGELPNARLAVVCDQSPARLEEMARRFPGLEYTTSVHEAMARDDVEAAVICTPAASHHQVARLCLEAGKHLLVEKPLTTVSSEGVELVGLARSAGLILMVGHTFVHNAGVRKLRSYVESGGIGRPYYLYSRRTNMGPIRRDVNAVWDLAPHDVSIFNYLLGVAPEWVSAVGARVLGNDREDVGFISLGYPDGIIGHIHVSWADPHKVREIVVVGSDKRIVFDDMNSIERVRIFEKGVRTALPESANYGEHQIQMREGDIISPHIEMSEPLKTQSEHFLECVANRTLPVTDGWDGVQVVRVMEAIDRSVATKGQPAMVEQGEAPGDADYLREKVPVAAARAMFDALQGSLGYNGKNHVDRKRDGQNG